MAVSNSNAQVAAALRQMAESGRIPHAMLFHQNDGGGAFPLILDFLDEVYGHNPRVKTNSSVRGANSCGRIRVSSRTNCMQPSASKGSRG